MTQESRIETTFWKPPLSDSSDESIASVPCHQVLFTDSTVGQLLCQRVTYVEAVLLFGMTSYFVSVGVVKIVHRNR